VIIRKLFKFENAHVVRKCTSKRCRESIHGHSYRVELLMESNFLDNGQMVYDFGLTKLSIKDLIDSFDHAVSIWNRDDPSYILAMKENSDRWVMLPVSPSAEQLSRVIFVLVDSFLQLNQMVNGENEVSVHSVIVHETDTGYAQAFKEDAYSEKMGKIELQDIIFSEGVKIEWRDSSMYDKMVKGLPFINPSSL
jgi:6-pyruvoyltetrahydropterin/6-carboxytetrahydropterin synthase